MKEFICWALTILIITVILGIGGFFDRGLVPGVGRTFTDSSGIEWRVLTKDSNGNKLIITEDAHGGPYGKRPLGWSPETIAYFGWTTEYLAVAYNNRNVYSRLSHSDTLRDELNAWFTDRLAPELKEIALPVENVDNDVRLEPNGIERFDATEYRSFRTEHGPEGISRASNGSATPENSLFVLSISEVNQYKRRGRLLRRGQNRSWWLRSPGLYANSVAYVDTISDVFIYSSPANNGLHIRPALWTRPK